MPRLLLTRYSSCCQWLMAWWNVFYDVQKVWGSDGLLLLLIQLYVLNIIRPELYTLSNDTPALYTLYLDQFSYLARIMIYNRAV